MKINILYLIIIVFVVACQDPFRDESDEIRNAKPVDVVDPDEQAIIRDAMHVETVPNVITLRERRDGEFRLESRLTDFDLEYEVIVKNLPVEATYDATTGVVRWKPPRGVVPSGESVGVHLLHVIMQTTEQPFIKVNKFFSVFVTRG